VSSDQARELRQQGIAAAKAGQKDQARQLLQQSIRIESNNEAAWLWLASVARDQRERIFCLQKILEINPTNETALRALEGINPPDAPAAAAPSTKRVTGESAAAVREQDIMSQPAGVPLPSAERIAEAQKQADALLRGYMMPLPSDVKWVHKTRRRAGEGDIIVLRLYITAAVVGFLIVLGIAGTILVLTNEDLRSLVFAPTGTPTHTPTVTPTFTPGFTPTPSVTPRVSPTPSATVDPNIPTANPFDPVDATAIYPPVLERPIEDSISLINRGEASVALPTLRAERNLTENRFNPNPYYYGALAYLAVGDTDTALEIMDQAEGRLEEAPNDNFGRW
jgi:tetratricopeptide (TPR) repeat protein